MVIGIYSKDYKLGIALRKFLNVFNRRDIGVMLICQNEAYDVALVGINPPKNHLTFSSDILIVPDCINADELPSEISDKVISYGLRKKNTVTASSLIGNRLVVSVQRSIPTPSGNTVEEQEIVVNMKTPDRADDILGIISALIVVGISSDELSSFVFSL